MLPLFDELPTAAVEREAPVSVPQKCSRCKLFRTARTAGVPPSGQPGGVLIVGEGPGKTEDIEGMPFVGKSGERLKMCVKTHYSGPVMYDNATRCYTPKTNKRQEIDNRCIEACRSHLAHTIEVCSPTRILALGAIAAKAIMGFRVAPMSCRRGFGFLTCHDVPIPVFFLIHPAAALRNRFVDRMFEADLKWALTTYDLSEVPWEASFEVVTSLSEATNAVKGLSQGGWVAWDVETAGRHFTKSFKLLSVALCREGTRRAYVWGKAALDNPETRKVLMDFLCDSKIPKIGQNVKFDMLSVYTSDGVMASAPVGDTLLWRKILDPDAEGGLDQLAILVGMGGMKDDAKEAMASAQKHVNSRLTEIAKQRSGVLFQEEAGLTEDPELDAIIRESPGDVGGWVYGAIPKNILHKYNARDAVTTVMLGEYLGSEIKKVQRLDNVWRKLVQGAAYSIAWMEAWGMHASRENAMLFDRLLEGRESDLLVQLKAFDSTVNWSSPKQLGGYIAKTCALAEEYLERTASGQIKTDKTSLKKISDSHEVPALVLKLRQIQKLRGTYAQGVLKFIRPDDRIHADYRISGAKSGRISCADPDMQNFPRPVDELGIMARNIMCAPPGYVLLSADYSQVELRVAAMLSQDPEMIKIFQEGVDFHLRTAQLVSKLAWNVEPESIAEDYARTGKSKYRSLAKGINFGVMYGMGDNSLAAQMGCTVPEAAAVKEAILSAFGKFNAWLNRQLSYARTHGIVWTYWDGMRARRRYLLDIASQDGSRRSQAEHGSWNSAIQGTAADYCLASLSAVVDWILSSKIDAKVVAQVHDSIVLEVHESCLDEVAGECHKIMTSWPSFGVPLPVDFEYGIGWGGMKPYQLSA